VKPLRRQTRMNDTLTPPVNVRVVGDDGLEYPVQTVYVGMEGDVQQYEVVDAPDRVQVVGMKVDLLPAKTEISFPMPNP
jgi:hypothetical protein